MSLAVMSVEKEVVEEVEATEVEVPSPPEEKVEVKVEEKVEAVTHSTPSNILTEVRTYVHPHNCTYTVCINIRMHCFISFISLYLYLFSFHFFICFYFCV